MIDNTLDKFNKNQKKLFMILIPLFLFIMFFPLVEEYSGSSIYILKLDFELDDAWWLWLMYLTIVGYLEFKILGKLD